MRRRTRKASGNGEESGADALPRMRSGLAGMPLAFLGFALWRAWVSLSYAAPAFDFPLLAGGGRLLYDVFLSLTALAVAFCARRVAPLNDQRALLVFCGVSMTASAAANLAALYRPELAAVLWLPAILLAGAGSALLILAWCEAYSCLNPVRAAVYLSLSMAGGVGLTFLLQGFRDAYLQGWLLALPVLSLLLARRAWRSLPAEDRPRPSGSMLLPWKFLALLSIYQLVAGMCAQRLGDEWLGLVGSHSTLATLIAACALFACAYFFSDRFDFTVLYRSPAVIMVCGLLLVPLFGFGGSVAGAFCVSASTMLFNMVVMLFLFDISKRLGVIAIWLFGLEEATLAFGWLGRGAAQALDGTLPAGWGDSAVAVVAVALVAAMTLLLLSEREVGTHWGIRFMGKQAADEGTSERARIIGICDDLAAKHGLSPRETEVLHLLAQGKSLSAVAGELFIAEGPAKAHTRHIYEKLGINARQELFDLLKVNPKGL